ncbi:MAG: hypothetical protein Q9196_005430 [Gyalolechia fulgens]
MTPNPKFGSKCNTLFLSLLATLPDPGSSSANPVTLDSTPPTHYHDSLKPRTAKMPGKQEGKMNWDGKFQTSQEPLSSHSPYFPAIFARLVPFPPPRSPKVNLAKKKPPDTDAADKSLLLQIIAGQDIRIDYGLVAPSFGCSASAVKQHVLKLKKEAKEAGFMLGSKPGDTSAGNETDGSPQKAKSTKGKTSNAAAKGKGKRPANDGEDSEEAAAATLTPAKKPRTRKPKGDDGGSGAASPAKKPKKMTEGKGKQVAKAEEEASPAAATDGSATPPSSEATTIKMEDVEGNADRLL